MTYTLFNAALDLARRVGRVWSSTATGGTVATVVDTKMVHPAGYFAVAADFMGVLFLDLTVPAIAEISDHVLNTITFTPAQAADIVAGDKYHATPPYYMKHELIQAINQALNELGYYPNYTELTPTVDQDVYTETDNALFGKPVINVERAAQTAEPYGWYAHTQWAYDQQAKRLYFYGGSQP